MLRRTVDEISEMQAEADAMIAVATAEIEAQRRKHEEELVAVSSRRKAMEREYREAKEALEAEQAGLHDDAWRAREQACWSKQRNKRTASARRPGGPSTPRGNSGLRSANNCSPSIATWTRGRLPSRRPTESNRNHRKTAPPSRQTRRLARG